MGSGLLFTLNLGWGMCRESWGIRFFGGSDVCGCGMNDWDIVYSCMVGVGVGGVIGYGHLGKGIVMKVAIKTQLFNPLGY